MEQHEFICFKRFKGVGISQEYNIPYGTKLYSVGDYIYLEKEYKNPICVIRSQVGCEHFAINDDNCGIERGNLTSSIINILSNRDKNYQTRWNKVWEDDLANTLRRKDYEDWWLWDTPFYQASIKDLTYILKLIKEVK